MMLRTMMPRTRLEWVERLAGAGMWIAIGASVYLESIRPEWMWVLAGCIMTLAVVSAVAGIPRRLAGRRLVLRKGNGRGRDSGLGGRGGDDDGPAGEAAHQWRTLAVVSRLIRLRRPPVAGRSTEPAGGGHGRPARRGGPQLPAVGAPAGDNDVGPAGPAAGLARPAAPGIRAARSARRPDPTARLARWGIPAGAAVALTGRGTNNRTLQVTAGDRRWFLRISQNLTLAQVQAEHRLVARLARAGLPFAVPAAVPLPDGSTVAGTRDGADRAATAWEAIAGRLPNQVVHADLAASNVLVSPDTGAVTGVLDFELAGYWIRAIELAVVLALSGSAHGPGWPRRAAAVACGGAWGERLTGAELAALPDLIVTRAVGSMLWRADRWRRGQSSLAEVASRLDVLAGMLRWRTAEGGELVHIVAAAGTSPPA
jgi:Ser/Thr protein kinase RdoA (MazF antagonist)